MNFSSLKTAVENVTGASSDTGRYLNKAQLLLAKDSKWEKSVNIAVTAGVITIPADCLIPKNIYYNGTELNYVEKDMRISTSTTTDPANWTKLSSQLLVDTKVTCTTDGTAVLYYIPRPATMTLDTDVPELNDADEALIAYARYMLYTDAEDEDSAAYWEGEWLKRRAEWLDLNGIQDYEIETIENVSGW